MAQSLSNCTISLPLSFGSGRTRKQIPNQLAPSGIKAMAGGVRDLQNAGKPKRRSAPVAPIGLWDRFPTVQQMMDSLIDDDPFEWPSSRRAGGGYGRGRTPWEIKESETEYKVRFDMPGMRKENVKVWVEEKMLLLKAEKSPKKKENGAAVEEEGVWSAESYGRYSTRIVLPENVELEKIRAEVRDGVLYVTIPKASGLGKVLDINVE